LASSALLLGAGWGHLALIDNFTFIKGTFKLEELAISALSNICFIVFWGFFWGLVVVPLIQFLTVFWIKNVNKCVKYVYEN